MWPSDIRPLFDGSRSLENRKYEPALKATQAHIMLLFSTRNSGPAYRALPEADNPRFYARSNAIRKELQ